MEFTCRCEEWNCDDGPYHGVPDALRAPDLRRLLALIDGLSAIPTMAAFPAGALALMGDLLPADSYAYMEINPHWRRAVSLVIPAAPRRSSANREALALRSAEHPVFAHYRAGGDRRALRISDFWSHAHFHQTALYRDFCRQSGTEFQLVCQVPMPAPAVIGVAFSRRRGDFSERERQVADRARRYLHACYQRLEPMTPPPRDDTRPNADLLALNLTPRQAEIVAQLSQGHSNKAIACVLGIAPATVKKHLEDAYRRLQVGTRAQAVIAARRVMGTTGQSAGIRAVGPAPDRPVSAAPAQQ
ncbi:MAG TPA: helix-turn-helix transcriptional regulator [Lamprocystis sp. (in: g-proteobacteria)]|nr:helix-turn-helix transcriptional regulator [Lamprocystis sp. (in: g-proteobacteria)]